VKGLTKRQVEIAAYIKEFIEKNRYSPSYREIQEHFHFSSLGSVYKHIQTLKRKGQIDLEKHCSRSLALPLSSDKQTAEQQLPFIGNITHENTIETFSQIQTIAVPASLISSFESTYVLRVRGDALNEELIGDGDLLIVEARQTAYTGELVIALMPDRKVIIKRYYPEGDCVKLRGHSSDSFSIKPEEFILQGVVIGLLRFFI
jgi:repressor LexA